MVRTRKASLRRHSAIPHYRSIRLEIEEVTKREHLTDVDRSMPACPTAIELCRTAGNWTRIKDLARERNDELTCLAGLEPAPAAASSTAHRGD
jgi:hypothetical protein